MTSPRPITHQIENKDTAVLRYQIRRLEDTGEFDFSAWV